MRKNKLWLPIFLVVVLLIYLLAGSRKIPETNVQIKAANKAGIPTPTTLTEASNSEGSMKLTGVSRRSPEGRVSYVFKVVETQNRAEKVIYETVADQGSSISIPANSWSPDYKQVFIKLSGPSGDNYYLFKANGEPYSDGKKYISVGDYWDKSGTTSKIQEISGWAGDDLLMVYTVTETGSHGPAYWFVTGTRMFMQVREL